MLRQKAFSPPFQASHHLWKTQQRDSATCSSALPPTAAHLMKQRMGQQACLLSRKPQCPHFMDKIVLLDRKCTLMWVRNWLVWDCRLVPKAAGGQPWRLWWWGLCERIGAAFYFTGTANHQLLVFTYQAYVIWFCWKLIACCWRSFHVYLAGRQTWPLHTFALRLAWIHKHRKTERKIQAKILPLERQHLVHWWGPVAASFWACI